MGMNELNTKALSPTHAIMGVDLDGNTVSMEIGSGPHWIICGQTGSGKSVTVNSILISMMYHAIPNDELIITWVDPKKVEATAYIGCPFCPIDPVTDMGDAFGLMQYLTWEMDRRYEDLSAINAKKIADFNDWVEEHPQEAKAKNLKKMPYWVVVIDEYADMVMQTKEVEAPIVRLAQKSRAAGIHLMIATQRPSVDIITGTIKANIPARIAMKVADSNNSMIIMDEPGAENLRGYGDSYIKTTTEFVRVQFPFVTDDEIAKIMEYLQKEYPQPDPIDYKTVVVQEGLCAWAEEYDENVPMEKRHVVKPRRRSGFGR